MFCPECGKKLENLTDFCPECGAKIKNSRSAELESKSKGFFKTLFDTSFSEFMTEKIIKFLFILGIIIISLFTLGVVIGGFANNTKTGLLFLVLSPLIFLFLLICHRVYCEILIVLFKIADYLKEINRKIK